MKKMIKSLANKAICAVFVVLGAMSVCAEVVTNDLYDAVNTDVKVGYEIRGLNDGKEVAVVFNRHSYDIKWNVPSNLKNVEYLIVGGGGGGGTSYASGTKGAGGGGAGGFENSIITMISAGSEVLIKVGAKGVGGANGVSATSGSPSKIIIGDNEYSVYGGGAGGSHGNAGTKGGSGGGGSGVNTDGTNKAGGSVYNSEEGNKGGTSLKLYAGGGGGAGGVGENGVSGQAGKGGPGKICEITGEPIYYAAGGGGGGNTPGAGGIGGGGAGGATGKKGSAATGYGCGGGGGTFQWAAGGAGYQGIVVLRYAYNFKAGDNYYLDFASAANNVAENDTIEILNNDEVSGSLDKSITLEIKEGVSYTGTITLTAANAVLTANKDVNVKCGVENYEVVEAVENGVYTYSLQVSNRTITLPEVMGAMWYYEGKAVENNIISVLNGTAVTVTLKANEGYIFADNAGEITINLGSVSENITVNDTQYTAPAERQPSGKFDSLTTSLVSGRYGLQCEFQNLYARKSVVFKVYDAEGNQLTETSYKKAFPITGSYTCSIVISGSASSSWTTEVKSELTVGNMPAKGELWIDGVLVCTRNSALADKYAKVYCGYDFVYKEALIGEMLYATLGAAVESAESNVEIVLLADVSVDLALDKSITLNLNEKAYKGTITLTDAAVQLTAVEGLVVETMVDGYEVVYADGVYGLVEKKSAVAQIGEQTFETLEAAFAAAAEGQEIDLLQDATPVLKSQSAITKAAVIDLNGKTLTLTEDDLYFGTTTFKNGTIVVDPSVKPSTAVFWMFANQTLTFDNVKIVATGVTGTYLIGLEGTNCDLNLLNGSEILVENTTALDLDIICVNGSTDNDIVIDNSKINVTNLDGRVLFRGNYTIKGTSEINLAGITKAGIRIEAGQTLSIEDSAKVIIAGEPRDGGIHLTDVTATYTKADTATVTATINKPYQLSGEGTEASPYLIQNIDDLIFFRDSVNKGETKYSAPGVWVALAADIDMAGENWVGIGSITQDHGFMGNFDGKTFKIKNLTINNPTLNGGYAYAGFFSITEGTETAQNIIKNLTIENVTINTTGQIVSAAIAYPYYTIVEDVKVLGDINITGGNYTAGALAYTRRCVNASNVSVVGNAGSTITGGQAVGGVISDIQMNGGLIANYSNFAAENLTISGTKMVGGISGIIATQTLNGATVKDVTINCADRAGQVAGSFGGTSTISNIVVENVTGADAIIGGGYDGSKPVEAKLGDTFYSTFAEAYSKATAGDTITLLADIAATEVILLDKNLTINGNGHKVTSSATRIFRVTTANTEVTLNDVNMVSTAVRVGTNDIRGISIDNVKGIKLTLNNCSVDFTDASANDWAYAVNVTGGSNHTLTVNGGTYEGANVINVRGENNTVVVKNAMLNSTYPNNDMYYGAGIWVEQEKGSSVEATGNTFNGSNAVAFNLGTGTTLTESNNIDNTTRCVAKIGGQYYTTFAAAYAAAQAGDTITLLADISSSAIIVLDKAITLDGNGKTLTSTAGRAINVSGADGVTIKNLTIDAKGERAINIIQNATNVTIDNVTATAVNYTVNVASSAPNAVVAIKNSTLDGLCTVNVSAAGAQVTVQDSTVNCNDNNTTAGESYAALSLNKEAVGGTIAVTGTTINVAEGSDSVEARNGAENGTITIDGSTAQVNTVVAYITYPGSSAYHAFYTLQSAIDFAKADDTITLLRDVTLTSKLTLNKAVTIDGNGHSIVADEMAVWYTVSGKLNIKNYKTHLLGINASGITLKNIVLDCNNNAAGINIYCAQDVAFENVSIINATKGMAALTVNGSTLTVSDEFRALGNSVAIDVSNGTGVTSSLGVTFAENTKVDLGNKTFKFASVANIDVAGAVTESGAPYFVAMDNAYCYSHGQMESRTTGYSNGLKLLADVSLNKDITVKGTLDLNGKTLTLAEGKVLKTGGNLTITGGAFANPILLTSASYTVKAPDGLNVITNVEGKKVAYENGVYKLVDIVYAAQIGEQKYETLQDALDAADGKTIVMLSDVVLENTVTIPASKAVTLDLNGKTVSMVYSQNATANHEMIHNYGDLTIQDTVGGGKISYQYMGASLGTTYAANTISTEPGSVLTVKSGTIENLTYDSAVIAYAIDGRTNGGAGDVAVNIEGGTITSLRQAIRIFANSTTNSGTLNISGGEMTGRVIVQNSNTNANKAALNITGGTFNANAYKTDVLYVGGNNSATIDINASISGGTFNGEITETNVEGFISGGTFNSKPKAEYCADDFIPVKVGGGYSVGVLPDAEVTNLGAITVGPGGYTADMYKSYDLINGGSLVDAIVPYDLTLAMDFKAKDTAEQAKANKFGGYTTDFFIKMEGMSEGSFVGDGCYLAGYYPSFKAWVKIPLDGFTVENNKVYPVITSAGFDFKYTDICGTVGQFICGIYLTPEVLAANPNLKVNLTLGLSENMEAALNAQFEKVDGYVYDADDLTPVELPEVEVVDIKSSLKDSDPDLTFALNFKIKDMNSLTDEYLEKLFAKYGNYYTDYVLTISGLTDPNGTVKFNANGGADGYLAGQYDAWSKNWVSVPFENVTIQNGQSLYIMEYAAKLMNKQGLRFTLAEVAEIVQNFDCGVYFTPEFLAANPNLKVDLELKVFTEDVNGNKVNDITVAKNEFTKANFGVAAVVAEGKQTQYFTSLADAVAAADGKTVRLLSDVELMDGIVIETGKNVTIDLAGFNITRTVGDVTANTQVFLNNGTLTIVDSADDDGEISLTYTGDRNPSVTISTIRNYGVLNVEGGTVNCISGEQYISYAIDAFSPGTVNISGGKVTGGASGYCIRMFLASTTSPVTLNVTGGEVGYVWAQQTNENANKGVINVEGGKVDYVYIDKTGSTICDASNVSVSIKTDATTYEPHIGEKGHIAIVGDYYKTIAAIALDIRIVDNKPQIGYAGNGILVLEAAVNLTGEWTKNISYTAVENDGDDAKTWVTPAEGYFFFKGFITK